MDVTDREILAPSGHRPRQPSPFSLSPRTWLDTGRRGWARAADHNMGLIAAGVAFYLFFAMVPLLASVIMLYGLIADPLTVAGHMASLSQALPASAADIVRGQIEGVVAGSGANTGFALVAALALALFGARNGAGSMMTALNVAFGCREGRGFLHRNLAALGITVGGALAAALLFAGIAAFGALQAAVAPGAALLAGAAQIGTWLALMAVMAVAVAMLFHFAPACPQPSLRWLTPGSLLAAVIVAVLTFLFGVYVANFGNYNATYGALGGVVVLLTWMWLTSYVVLLGAECEAALIDQARPPRS